MAKKEPIVKGQKEITIRANGTKRVRTINNLPSRTQQQFKEQCDVNNIMAKYKKTGTITHVRNAANGVYMDLTEIPDLLTARLQLQEAETAFLQMPASLRHKFNNDPAELISYLSNPSNHTEAIHLGLMVKRENDKSNDDIAKPPQAPEASPKPS